MRVTLERSNLLKSLSHVYRVVERKNTIAILSNVLLSASGSELTLKATDLDLEITETAPAMVEQSGETTVPAHLLHDIVRKLHDGAEVMLSLSDDGLFKCDSRQGQFPIAVPAEIRVSGTFLRHVQPYLPDAV
jgi:DNA polymerase III subunit beta